VVKKDKTQCQFVTSKLKRGVMLALEKRPISAEVVETLISNILEKISQVAQNDEISTEQIGYIVLAELKKTDAVAYVRFASVYQSFNSVESFRSVVTDLEENSKLNHEIGG